MKAKGFYAFEKKTADKTPLHLPLKLYT